MTTGALKEAELAYLQSERRLGRIATVGRDGTPHVVPIGMWHYNPKSTRSTSAGAIPLARSGSATSPAPVVPRS